MSLEAFLVDEPSDDIQSLIKRRRMQVMIHACVYYKFNDNIISDHQYDDWCNELVSLLKKHPKAYSDDYDKYFEGWEGETGFHFPITSPYIMEKAQRLLSYRDKHYAN